jgi:hypothetical protein
LFSIQTAGFLVSLGFYPYKQISVFSSLPVIASVTIPSALVSTLSGINTCSRFGDKES